MGCVAGFRRMRRGGFRRMRVGDPWRICNRPSRTTFGGPLPEACDVACRARIVWNRGSRTSRVGVLRRVRYRGYGTRIVRPHGGLANGRVSPVPQPASSDRPNPKRIIRRIIVTLRLFERYKSDREKSGRRGRQRQYGRRHARGSGSISKRGLSSCSDTRRFPGVGLICPGDCPLFEMVPLFDSHHSNRGVPSRG